MEESAYTSLVRPLVEYVSPTWDPYNQSDIQKLEMFKRRVARYVNSKHMDLSSVDEMIKELKLKPLEDRWRDARLAGSFLQDRKQPRGHRKGGTHYSTIKKNKEFAWKEL